MMQEGKMAWKAFIACLIVLGNIEIALAGNAKSSGATSSVPSHRILDVNRIAMQVSDRGNLVTFYGVGGAIWPDTGKNSLLSPIVYDHGPWIIGKVNGVPSAAMDMWYSSYAPGPIIGGMPALWVRPQDSSRYHPYLISYNSSPADSDVVSWPADLGAPVNSQGKPLVLGDQLVWSVYNGADSTAFPLNFWSGNQFSRLPVEVQQSCYAQRSASENDTSLLANTVFLEWMFINKGNLPVDSCYLGFWSDIDTDYPDNDVPGIDTSLQLGYCWQGDSARGTKAVGYELLYGPVTSDPGSSAMFKGRMILGYRNMPLSAFRGIIFDNGLGDNFFSAPASIVSCWNLARGYDQAGEVMIDSVTGLPTRFPYSGDPVTKSGWIYSNWRRKGSTGILMFAGPFNFAVGDTQWMMIALIPADAGERFASITLMRQHAQKLRTLTYDEITHAHPLSINTYGSRIPGTVELDHNYPNPFNPSTTIRYALPERSRVTLSVYNTLGQEVATLVNNTEGPGYHEVKFDGSNLASGVYFYRLQAGSFVKTMKSVLIR
jgi:hypothetical protein